WVSAPNCPTPISPAALKSYLLRVAEAEVLGLLIAARDQAGVLYRLSETIFRHGANITYVAGGAHRENLAELQLEVVGAPDRARLIADIEGLQGITRVSTVPTFERIYGKRVIVIGGGAQVGMVAQGAISEADRHNIRGGGLSPGGRPAKTWGGGVFLSPRPRWGRRTGGPGGCARWPACIARGRSF